MKKIINGKKYDTDTAKAVCSWSNGCSYSDFNYMEETLYLKKTGEFFIYGEGGARSKYSTSCGSDSWCGGSAITPISEAEAKVFFEEHGDADDYEEIFGEVEE